MSQIVVPPRRYLLTVDITRRDDIVCWVGWITTELDWLDFMHINRLPDQTLVRTNCLVGSVRSISRIFVLRTFQKPERTVWLRHTFWVPRPIRN